MPAKASPGNGTEPRELGTGQFDRVLSIAARLALIVMGGLALIVALSLGKVILAPIALAMVVGLMFGPLTDMLDRRGVAPALSAAVAVLVFIGVLSLAAGLFAVPLSQWIERVPAIWSKLQAQLAVLKAPLESLAAIQDQLKSVMGSDAAVTVEVKDGGAVQNIALMAPSVLADVLLFLAGLYFFLATRHSIRIAVLSLCFSRRARWRTAHIFRDVELKVSRFLLTATALNLCVGAATAIAAWALGMPSPLLWGALAAVMNFVPYVGQAVMYVVLLAVGLGTQPTIVAAILPFAAYAAINFTADQVVFPHFVGRTLTLNPFVIFVSIAFWLWLWGPMGGFISVPALLVLQSLILHTFPSTRAIPERTLRKLEEQASAESAAQVAAEADKRVPAAAAAAAAPKTPVRRKTARRAAPASER